MMLADFHTHSTFSDGSLSIPELVDFYGERGFGAIAVTDHICENETFMGKAAGYLRYTLTPDSFSQYLDIIHEEAERAWKQFRMIVLPGYEISKNSWLNHRSAHFLGIGVNKYVPADLDLLEQIRSTRAQGAVTVAAHPVSTRRFEMQTYHLWNRREELAQEFDAWEVASGPHLFTEVMETNLPKLATSDFHHPRQINAWKTVLYCERHREAILDAIRKQDLSFQFYAEATGTTQLIRSMRVLVQRA